MDREPQAHIQRSHLNPYVADMATYQRITHTYTLDYVGIRSMRNQELDDLNVSSSSSMHQRCVAELISMRIMRRIEVVARMEYE